jgi:hypothetical protein
MREARMRRLLLVIALGMVVGTSAFACMRMASPAGIDAALAQATLSEPDAIRVKALRSKTAELMSRREYSAAANTEAQAMAIMGLELQAGGPPTRGACGGTWVRKEQ